MHDFAYIAPQCRCEGNAQSAPRSAVPYPAFGYFDVKHLLEAQRLGAELKIGSVPMTRTRFVFDRSHGPCLDLHRVRATRQPERLGPERNRSQHKPSPFAAVGAAIDSAVRS